MKKKFAEGGTVPPEMVKFKAAPNIPRFQRGVARATLPGLIRGVARDAALSDFEEEGRKALEESRLARRAKQAEPKSPRAPVSQGLRSQRAQEMRDESLGDYPSSEQEYRKGGRVNKYAEGGMVEIEIKVGGGGKHKMPDGSMMEDDEMESEDYKKGGRVKKMAKGGITNKKFIQQAIKKPGALRAQLGAKAGQNIPAKKLATAAKAPGKLGQRARFAQTLAKMRKK